MKKISIADVEPLIGEHKGNVAKIAKSLGVSRGTIWNRIRESAKLQDKLTEAREALLDDLEQTLYDKALSGDIAALIFALKTQGKARGFTERHEVAGPDGGPIRTHSQTQVEHGLSPDFFAAVVRILGEADADPGALETGEAVTATGV